MTTENLTGPVLPEPNAETQAEETPQNEMKVAEPTTMTRHQATYVVLDTETNGMFLFKDKETGKPVPADDPRQPRLCSVALIYTDDLGREIEREKFYVKPDGWTIDGTEAGEINGLTDAFLEENGVPVEHVLDIWEGIIANGMIAAAYNAQFDCKMMRAELRRAGRNDLFEETKNTCIMRGALQYRKQGMTSKSGGWVKLEEVCGYLGIELKNAHDAMADAEAAMLVMQHLIADGLLIEPKVHYAKGK